MSLDNKNIAKGIGYATLATLIWSGNFIIARGLYKQIDPISLAFYRWTLATLIIFPVAIKNLKAEWNALRAEWFYILCAAAVGISLFNTLVYLAGHYTTAINLALIGTTSSPVISVILARVFLKERIGLMKIMGIIICIAGILFLLAKGSLENLLSLQFSLGDVWILVAAFCFAVYNVLVRKKPTAISSLSFLSASFVTGTVLLAPFFVWANWHNAPENWDFTLLLSILYLGAGASVICFLLWNISIGILGAGRTALFGNLIPVFSSLEAVVLLNEKFSWVHVISMIVIFSGLLLANLRSKGI